MRQSIGIIALLLLVSSGTLAQAHAAPFRVLHLSDPEPKFRVASSEINYWMGKPVYSSDNKKIGEITDLRRDPDNAVTEVFISLAGFLDWAKHYEITAEQIQQVQGNRAVLMLNKSEAEGLPETQDERPLGMPCGRGLNTPGCWIGN